MTAFDVRPVEAFEMDSWDAFVESQPGGCIYHTSLWQRLINDSYGDGQYVIVAAFGKDGIAGGFCALRRNRLGVETAVTPLLTPYTGYLVAPDLGGSPGGSANGAGASALAELAAYARRYRYQSLQCAPHLGDVSVLETAGYQLTPRRTFEVNLRLHEDELWAGFAGQVRRNVKKARRSDFEISDRWDAAQGWALFEQTFARHGQKCIVPEAYFAETCAGVILAENRRRYCAWWGDRLVGFLVALHFKDTVYYHLAAADGEALKSGVASLLVWDLMRDFSSQGFGRFDFVGGNTASIARFKEGFGVESVPHYLLEKCSSRRIRMSRGMRRWLTRR